MARMGVGTTNWEKIFRTVIAAAEFMSLQLLGMIAVPGYADFTVNTMVNARFALDDAKEDAKIKSEEIKKDFEEKKEEFNNFIETIKEESKEEKVFKVSTEEELNNALAQIENSTQEEIETKKFTIEINGEINVTQIQTINARGKQPTEENKYFETNAGIVLPQGVTIALKGNDPENDKLKFGNQKIGIYGENLGNVSIQNLTIERDGTQEQVILDNELVRSFVYLTTKKRRNTFSS